ncbi:MAG: hypothetical protein KF905_04595 [Flavobacteriales bacterium]|nr:hypothetical protein [Flavobacteriales bacterium]
MIIPNLGNLTSLFEVFAIANLGYAGSKTFQEFLSDGLLTLATISPGLQSKLEEAQAKLTVLQDGNPDLLNKFKQENERFEFLERTIDKVCAYKATYFPQALKPGFMMSGLFSLYVLIASGWATGESNLSVLLICLSSSLGVIFFNLYLFVKSFNRTQAPRWVRPVEVILIFAILLFVIPLLIWNTQCVKLFFLSENGQSILFFTIIFAAIAPYLLYFIRAFMFKYHKQLRLIECNIQREKLLHDMSIINKYGPKLPGETQSTIFPYPNYWQRNIKPYFSAMSRYGSGEIDIKYKEQLTLPWVSSWSRFKNFFTRK